MSYGVAESELLTEDTVLRRVQGASSYKVRTGLDVKKDVNAKHASVKVGLRTKITGVAYLPSSSPTRKTPRSGQDPGDTLSGLLPRRHERPVQSAAGS